MLWKPWPGDIAWSSSQCPGCISPKKSCHSMSADRPSPSVRFASHCNICMTGESSRAGGMFLNNNLVRFANITSNHVLDSSASCGLSSGKGTLDSVPAGSEVSGRPTDLHRVHCEYNSPYWLSWPGGCRYLHHSQPRISFRHLYVPPPCCPHFPDPIFGILQDVTHNRVRQPQRYAEQRFCVENVLTVPRHVPIKTTMSRTHELWTMARNLRTLRFHIHDNTLEPHVDCLNQLFG